MVIRSTRRVRRSAFCGAIAVIALVIATGAQPAVAESGITGFWYAHIFVTQTQGIVGEGFTGASSVSFRGAQATEFTVVDDQTIEVKVPIGALTGKVHIEVPGGTLVSPTKMKIAPWPQQVDPDPAARGSSITIRGYTFTGVKRVQIGGELAEFVVDSYTQITATVPLNARVGFGRLRVYGPGGNGAYTRFRVT